MTLSSTPGRIPARQLSALAALCGRMTVVALGLVTVAALTGCGRRARPQAAAAPPPKPQIKIAPPTPIAVKKVELGEGDPWNPAWDVMIEKALPHGLLSNRRARAVEPLCPRFRYMTLANKRAFWAYFFQALAGAEAGLKPTADVRHTEPAVAILDTVTHRTVRQEGLLQLTYMDSRRYGCAFNWQKDKNLPEHDPAKTILRPRNNLLCGIKILDNQLIARRKPLLSESSYWVTLRPDHPSFDVFWKQMANVPEACGARLLRPMPASLPAQTVPAAPVESAARNATR